MSTSVYWFNKGIIRVCFLTAPIWRTFLQGFSKHENVKRRLKMKLKLLPSSKYYISSFGESASLSNIIIVSWWFWNLWLIYMHNNNSNSINDFVKMIKQLKLSIKLFSFQFILEDILSPWNLKRKAVKCKLSEGQFEIHKNSGFYYFMKAFKPPPALSVSWL